MLKKIAVLFISVALALGVVTMPASADINTSGISRAASGFYASQYTWRGSVVQGNTATGSQTVILGPSQVSLADGRQMQPFGPANNILTPVSFDLGANNETVTPTAVSQATCPFTGQFSANATCIAFTGSFSFTHGTNATVGSGSFGLQEAINDAFLNGGGDVVIDQSWQGTNALITAALVQPKVYIEDKRSYAEQFWVPQGGSTVLATPATLTAVTALPSTTPVGAFTATNYNMCIAYVDIMGQEGNCSTSFVNTGAGATSSFIFSAPAASTGAVGYTIYIGLTGAGSTTLQYKVPLVTQPSVVGNAPVSNGVCTLTTVETTTPACAVTNTTYGQTGSTATVTAITVNTSQIQPETTIISTTSVYVPNPGGRNAYSYVPGSHIGTPGLVASELVFPIGAAAATTVPDVEGTINLPPGFMNFVGRTIEICGYMTTTASTATIENVQMQWDSQGQNTAGKGVPLVDMTATTTLATTGHISFCADLQTTVASASATGGTINAIGGFQTVSGVTIAGTNAAGTNTITGGAGSLNLADSARINVIYLHTTGTDGAGYTLQSLTAKVIN